MSRGLRKITLYLWLYRGYILSPFARNTISIPHCNGATKARHENIIAKINLVENGRQFIMLLSLFYEKIYTFTPQKGSHNLGDAFTLVVLYFLSLNKY